jgi:hypothetical protein
VPQVIEHRHQLGHHERGIRHAQVVGRRVGEALEVPDSIISQVTHRAAEEARELGRGAR